jgi:hypothetical protein
MHDLVVRDLELARNRTLGPTDLDDPTLVTQHDLLMSPLVWDLAGAAGKRSCWLQMRAGLRRAARWWPRCGSAAGIAGPTRCRR